MSAANATPALSVSAQPETCNAVSDPAVLRAAKRSAAEAPPQNPTYWATHMNTVLKYPPFCLHSYLKINRPAINPTLAFVMFGLCFASIYGPLVLVCATFGGLGIV